MAGESVGAEVRVVGSDLLGKEFSAAVYSGALRIGSNVQLAFDGSRPGLGRLKSNWADMGLLTLPAGEAAQLKSYHVETLAYHCLWVLVTEECPLEQISYAQLAGLFGATGAPPLRSWSDLGAGQWSEKPLNLAAPETGAGVMLEYFRSVATNGAPLRDDVVRYRDASELAALLSRQPHTIALVTEIPAAGAKVRALAVSAAPAVPGVKPTPATIHSGEYPLRLPLQLVLPHDRKEALWAWIAWWRSEEATRAFTRAGLVPVAKTD